MSALNDPAKHHLTLTQQPIGAAGHRLILGKELKEKKGIPFKMNHLRKLWRLGEFPVPVRLTSDGHHIAFIEHEIDAWLADKAAHARIAS